MSSPNHIKPGESPKTNSSGSAVSPGSGDRTELVRLEKLEIGYGQGRKRKSIAGKMDCNVFGGELVSLMGRNGSGKSTLLRTIAGLQQPVRGRIMIEGRAQEEYHRMDLARMLGFVSTEVVRVQGLRVRDLVAMGRYPHTGWFGSLSSGDQDQIDRAIELTSLGTLVERDLDELSDGERQRAMIARTLAQDTRIMVLDEPTAFLDLTHRHEITLLLGELAREHGKTIIFSSHDLQLSLKQADKIWLIQEDGIVEGAPEDLVLNGKLEEGLLQDSASGGFKMDPHTGDLEMHVEYKHSVSLTAGSDETRAWTIRSLERSGIRVEENKKHPVHVFAEKRRDESTWRVEEEGRETEFKSIYDLSLYLRTIL
jgi:iron complex transport system ATP-binding protein